MKFNKVHIFMQMVDLLPHSFALKCVVTSCKDAEFFVDLSFHFIWLNQISNLTHSNICSWKLCSFHRCVCISTNLPQLFDNSLKVEKSRKFISWCQEYPNDTDRNPVNIENKSILAYDIGRFNDLYLKDSLRCIKDNTIELINNIC